MKVVSLKSINLMNIIIELLFIVGIGCGLNKLNKNFDFTNFMVLLYGLFYFSIIFVIIVAKIREKNPPEVIEIFEDNKLQMICFILISLLLIGTSTTGIVIGCFIIIYSLITLICLRNYYIESESDSADVV